LILRYVDDLDLKEIAEVLGIKNNAVFKVRIHRPLPWRRLRTKTQGPIIWENFLGKFNKVKDSVKITAGGQKQLAAVA